MSTIPKPATCYGRTLAALTAERGDGRAALMAVGLAVEWRPGPVAWEQRHQHWCGGK